VNAARVRKFPGVRDVARVVDRLDVLSRVEALDRAAGDRRELRRALGRFLQRRLERFVFPPLFAALRNRFHLHGIIPARLWRSGPRRLTTINADPAEPAEPGLEEQIQWRDFRSSVSAFVHG